MSISCPKRARANDLKPYRCPSKPPLVSKYVAALKRNTQSNRRPFMLYNECMDSASGPSTRQSSSLSGGNGSYDFVKNSASLTGRSKHARRDSGTDIPDNLDVFFRDNSARKPPLRPRRPRDCERQRKQSDGSTASPTRKGGVRLLNPRRIGEPSDWKIPDQERSIRKKVFSGKQGGRMSTQSDDEWLRDNHDEDTALEQRVPSDDIKLL